MGTMDDVVWRATGLDERLGEVCEADALARCPAAEGDAVWSDGLVAKLCDDTPSLEELAGVWGDLDTRADLLHY